MCFLCLLLQVWAWLVGGFALWLGLILRGGLFFVELCGDFVGFGVGLACLSNATKKGRKSRQSSGRG